MTLKIHNTLTKKIEPFVPISGDKVTLYTCGPTVYDRLHVGNWTAYIFWDTLVRTLIADGYNVERVMNITDVGHLVSDEDAGEDKLEKGARREGKTAWDIAEMYSEDFLAGMEKLGLTTPEHIVRATDFIPQQLDLVRVLKEKGFTYQIDDGIYFDTSKFPTYADFAGLDLAAQKAGARVEFNPQKRNHSDFALWKFTASDEKRDMEWETPADLLEPITTHSNTPPDSHVVHSRSNGVRSPGGGSSESFDTEASGTSAARVSADAYSTETRSEAVSEDSRGDSATSKLGFPGWHLECSAMAMSILGATIDIHTGGIDHIPVHHTNEIAQSEAASGQPFAHYWLHNNHLKVNGTKISKSLQNGYTLQDLKEHGYTPLDFRMFVLQGHYSNEGNFTFENLTAAKNRLAHWRNVAALRHQVHDTLVDDSHKSLAEGDISLVAASGAILEALNNNLNTPEALRIVDQAFAKLDGKPLGAIHQHGLVQVLGTIDEVLGLQLLATTPDIDDATKQLILKRQRAREEKNWEASDQIRGELAEKNIVVRDTARGSIWEYAD